MSVKKSNSSANRKRKLRSMKNARSEILKKSLLPSTEAARGGGGGIPIAEMTEEKEEVEEEISQAASSEFVSPISSQQQHFDSVKSSMDTSTRRAHCSVDMTDYTRIGNTSNTALHGPLDPAVIFPFSNKPHEARKKTIAEESKRWESLFDPQYTFGSFQHGITRPVNQYFYRGKWPLDEEDIMGMIPKAAKKRMSHPTDTPLSVSTNGGCGEEQQPNNTLFPSVPSPLLPNLKQLELHMKDTLNDNEYTDGNTQIEILPCPSLSSFPNNKPIENEELYRERLELLKMLQTNGFDKELNDGTRDTPYKESAAARLQRQIKKKAVKMKRETLVDSSTEDEDNSSEAEEVQDENQSQIDDEFHGLHVAIAPQGKFFPSSPAAAAARVVVEEELEPVIEEEQIEHSSLASIDDYENISFHAVYDKEDCEKVEAAIVVPVEPEAKRKNRPSFLYFAYGFLFPPLWIIGALYSPSSNLERTTASKKIDQKWKKYSRNALFIFITAVITSIVLILVLKPQAVGFRNSNGPNYENEWVVFDEVGTSVAV